MYASHHNIFFDVRPTAMKKKSIVYLFLPNSSIITRFIIIYVDLLVLCSPVSPDPNTDIIIGIYIIMLFSSRVGTHTHGSDPRLKNYVEFYYYGGTYKTNCYTWSLCVFKYSNIHTLSWNKKILLNVHNIIRCNIYGGYKIFYR